jgi:hypothetical protein
MNSWQIIRDELTKDSRNGSCGYYIALGKAATLFCRLNGSGKMEKEAETDFNTDKDVVEACMVSVQMKGLVK